MYSQLLALQSTFPEPQWGCTFRWVFEQPEVQDAIARRLAEGQVVRMGGADRAMGADR